MADLNSVLCYSHSARFLQKDRATALPKFVKALIATYEVVSK